MTVELYNCGIIRRDKNGKILKHGFSWKLHKALKDKSSYPSLCHLKKKK